ncbi:zinc finger E-box-binding homeobox 1, partial [Ixodes scapularis]|uniref:zinc finger E-box-binding homeobox 1 n=1 Tax=Ixodes scapularis TaxID=6945 RepID=UPI001C391EE8
LLCHKYLPQPGGIARFYGHLFITADLRWVKLLWGHVATGRARCTLPLVSVFFSITAFVTVFRANVVTSTNPLGCFELCSVFVCTKFRDHLFKWNTFRLSSALKLVQIKSREFLRFSTVHGVHHTNRPHRCHLCFRAFGNKAHLRRHLLSHTGEKPFGCPFCERRFSQACNAKVHVANVHSQAKTRSKPAFEYPGALRGRRSSGRRVPSSVPSATTQPTTRATCRRTSASTPASAPSSVAGARGGSGTGPT